LGHPCVPLHFPVRWLRVSCHRYRQGVPRGGNLRRRSRLRWGVRAGLRRLTLVEERPACRAWGAQREGVALGCGPGGGGVHGCPRCTSRLRSTLPGRLPRGSVSVWRCAAMSCAPGSADRGSSDPGGADVWGRIGGVGGGMRACAPSRESSRKAHVRHLGAGIRSVPPRSYTGRYCGSCHRLRHWAHYAAHHGYWGPGHSGAMISMRQPSRSAFVTTSSRRLNGVFAHKGPAVA